MGFSQHESRMDMGSDMGSDMSSNSSTSSSMTSMMMSMVFQTERATPLYSDSWTPRNAGAYAGTCIFLIILAIIARCLVAYKTYLEARWQDRDLNRRYVAANGKVPLAEHIARDPDVAKQMMTLSESGIEETVFVVARKGPMEKKPWRFSVDPVRATLDTVIVGIGYLLMLAVMTMNVGYFLSVLAGVFVGSLIIGRYSNLPEH